MPETTANAIASAAEDAIVTADLAGRVRVCPVPGGVELSHTAGTLGAPATTELLDQMRWSGFAFSTAWNEGLTRVLLFDVADESVYERLTATRADIAEEKAYIDEDATEGVR